MNPYDYNGQQIDLDGFPPNQPFQCYDWANFWSNKLGYGRFTGLNAYDIFGQQPQNYSWIRNSPTGIPPKGAVVVWDGGINNGPGHVAVATGEGDTNYFVSLDQNWGQPRIVPVRHNYNHVIGWGVPNNNQGVNEMIPDGDNEFARWNDLHHRLRGRYSDRPTFQAAAVGKTWLSQIELLSDDPEANQHEQNANIGALAIKDNWQQQIYDLAAQNKTQQDSMNEMGKQIRDLQAQLNQKPISTDTKWETFKSLIRELIK